MLVLVALKGGMRFAFPPYNCIPLTLLFDLDFPIPIERSSG